jgi:hypothetical protein
MIAVFFAGFIMGMAFILFLSYVSVNAQKKKIKDAFAKVVRTSEQEEKILEAVRPRLKQAAEISNRQVDLLSQAQMPSKNSLHSRHKNDLIGEIKMLEEEKRSILRSILNEGVDPKLTITNDNNEKEIILLSEYMLRNGIPLKDEAEPVPANKPETKQEEGKITKVGKFYVVPGGKNDTSH